MKYKAKESRLYTCILVFFLNDIKLKKKRNLSLFRYIGLYQISLKGLRLTPNEFFFRDKG